MLKDLPDRLRKQAVVMEDGGHLTVSRLMGEAAHELDALHHEPTLADLRQMVAAIGVAIRADDATMSCLMQACKIGWEVGSGRKIRHRVKLRASSTE